LIEKCSQSEVGWRRSNRGEEVPLSGVTSKDKVKQDQVRWDQEEEKKEERFVLVALLPRKRQAVSYRLKKRERKSGEAKEKGEESITRTTQELGRGKKKALSSETQKKKHRAV